MTGRRSNGGGGSSSLLVYGTAIAIWVSILLGSLAMTAQAGRSSHQLLSKARSSSTTRALYLASNTSSGYHTEVQCFDEAADGGDERRNSKTAELITLIFCTAKCYCHSDRADDICYCCQKPPTQVCYGTIKDCQANCPVCNPTCPAASGTAGGPQQLHHAAAKNATL